MKRTLGFIFFGSLLFRLWFTLGYWSEKPLTQDAREYLELAQNYNATGEFAYHEGNGEERVELTGRAPGYPFWLAMLLRVGPLLSWIRLAECLLSLLTTALFLLIARELFGARSAIIAFAISSFYLPLIWLVPQVLSENLWVFVMLACYFFLIRSQQAGRKWNSILAFALLGVATLIRPGTVFVIPFLLWWQFRKHGVREVCVAGLVYGMMLLPWNLYLHEKEGRWIFVASEGGVTFWTATHPEYSGDGDLASNPAVQSEYRKILLDTGGQSSSEREQVFWNQARRNVFDHPGHYCLVQLKKLLYWVLPIGNSVRTTSKVHLMSSLLFYLALLIPALYAWKSISTENRFLFLGIIASFTLMILVFMPQERFRIASIDPLLILCASSLNHRDTETHRKVSVTP